MPRHAIHLGAAWETPATPGGPWVRRFGRPSGVGPRDRVLLVWDPPGAVSPKALDLNGQALATDPEVDVTTLLGDRNELSLFVDPLPEGEPRGERAALPVAWGRPTLVIVVSD